MVKSNIVTLDAESFWSQTHSLTKMSPIEYVMHEDTEIISLAMKVNNDRTEVAFGYEIPSLIDSVDWSNAFALGHNLEGFDSMILAWRYGVNPKLWMDTMQMARYLGHAKTTGLSLKALTQHYGLGVKDATALTNTKGKHLKDFTPAEFADMREYNKEDVELTFRLFKTLAPRVPSREMILADKTIRMLTNPQFDLDTQLLEKTLAEERERKHFALVDVAHALDVYEVGQTEEETAEAARALLASAPKFAEFLTKMGVDVPMKPSPTNPEKMTYALAKTDEAFTDLTSHENPMVAAAAQARLGVKSTILETRIEAFLQAGNAVGGKLPVPLKFYGADTTGRWSGWAYNPQNLSRIDPSKPKPSDALRLSLRAPKGYKVVVADLSGIELRVNHFLWKVPSSMGLFQADPDKADLYKDFASRMYDIPIDAVTKAQRQMGKVCVAEGTLIYCLHENKRFWVPIEQFKPEYRLWDGEEWVWAQGVVSNGLKRTHQLCGVSLTPDHLVLCGTTWLEARYVRGEKTAQALATGAENLSLLDMLRALKAGSLRSSLSATAGFLSTRLKQTISTRSKPRGAIYALKNLAQTLESCIGGTLKSCLMTSTGSDYSIVYQQRSTGATNQRIKTTQTTGGGAYTSAANGVKTAASFLGTCKLYLDGIFQSLKWTVRMLTVGTTSATYDSLAVKKTRSTNVGYRTSNPRSENWKTVYDVLNCGPRNRFTILTDDGPLIVHNCHLGLGFGAGPATFRKVAKLMAGIALSEVEANDAVYKWREEYAPIVQGWKTCHQALACIYEGSDFTIDPWGMCTTTPEGIKTPQGMIRYPDLRQELNEKGKPEWVYGQGRNKARIYAGKVTENIVQHLAREVIADNLLQISEITGYDPASTVHDELIFLAPESEAEDLLATVQSVMRTPPKWWPELITWSEGSFGDTYGEVK